MALEVLERNRFFYGKLMDVAQFEKEQSYFRKQIALLNRLTLGSGVICGLGVSADPDQDGNVLVAPGVAIDGLGRVVIVPAAVSVNPAQPTGDDGAAVGNPVTSGETIMYLCFRERCADPVPALVSGCDMPGDCTDSTTRESFRIVVRAAAGAPADPAKCGLGLPVDDSAELQKILTDYVANSCADPPTDPCVPLARITFPGLAINIASDRTVLFTGLLLRQINLCLGLKGN